MTTSRAPTRHPTASPLTPTSKSATAPAGTKPHKKFKTPPALAASSRASEYIQKWLDRTDNDAEAKYENGQPYIILETAYSGAELKQLNLRYHDYPARVHGAMIRDFTVTPLGKEIADPMPKAKRLKTTAELEELNQLLATNTTARQPVLPYEYHQRIFPAGVPTQRYYGLRRGKKLTAGAIVAPMVIGEATARKQLGENLHHHVYDQWNLSWIATALAARRLGHGRAVVEKIIADARQQGITRLKGAADGPVELNDFFKACGFTVTDSPDDPATEDLRSKHPNYHNPRNGSRFFYMDL